MADIERGDTVVVVMARNNVFPFQTAPSFKAVYQAGPCGPGDVFSLLVGGTKVLLNGNSSEFVAIRSVAEEDDDE